MLGRLDGHVVLCGGGRTGRQVMEELIALGQEFVFNPAAATRLDVGDETIVLGQPD